MRLYGFYFPGDPGFPGTAGPINNGVISIRAEAWRGIPRATEKCPIRAGYAFGYAYVPGISRQDQAGSNPWGGRSTFAQPGTNFANP